MWKIDSLLGVGAEPSDDYIDPASRSGREVRAMLETMYCSGTAFIVCSTEEQRNKAMEYAAQRPLVFRECEITLAIDNCEPETVLWQGYGNRPSEVRAKVVVGLIALLVTIILLDTFFYFPSVAYFMSMSSVKGMTQGGFEGTLLGLLVCVCNAIIYIVIGKITDWIGFDTVGRHERFYVVCYTFAVFFNTVIDLGVVMLLAQGYTMDQAITMQTGDDSSMSTKAMSESPTLQRSIYMQYVAYIFPSCLLVPFVAEPFANQFFFSIMKWLVGSRTEVTVQDAEIMLQCPPFDLARYGDILVNVMLCLGTLAFTFRDLWWIFGCLAISLAWLCCLDKWRFLRATTRSSFVSTKMEVTAQWLFAFPCAIIAAALAFRIYGHMLSDDWREKVEKIAWLRDHVHALSKIANQDVVIVLILAAAGLHVLIHFSILRFFVPSWSEVHCKEHDYTVPYIEKCAVTPCNWFNANPVNCLRSQYFYKHEIPCVKFMVGRTYLLRKNPAIGLYFENDSPPETSKALSMSTLIDEMNDIKQDVKLQARSTLDWVTSPKAGPSDGKLGEAETSKAASSADDKA